MPLYRTLQHNIESSYLEVRVLRKVLLQVPEPAWVHDPEEEGPAEVTDDDGHDGEDGVHHGQLHQFLEQFFSLMAGIFLIRHNFYNGEPSPPGGNTGPR